MRIAVALACAMALNAPQAVSAAGAGMVTAPMKGIGAGVVVQYRIDGTPEVGRPVSVLLSFDGITDPAGAAVRLSTQGRLSLAGTESTRNLPAAQVTHWTVQVVPAADGLGYLNVFTTQGGATTATSIPVPAGKQSDALPPSKDIKQSADGEKILPMKVK